jgi:dihydroflavonol-4-reductase
LNGDAILHHHPQRSRVTKMKKTIFLLTGAAGLLGSNISRTLNHRGQTVRALVLKGDPAAERLPQNTEVVFGDLLDISSLERFFSVPEGMDIIVIHSASIVTVDPYFNEKVHDVNVTGTRNIVDMCVKHKVKKLVYISSTSVIPELPGNQPIVEVDRFDPEPIIGYYGKTKAEASQIVMDAVHKYNLDASIVFPSGICGPYDYAFGMVSNFIIDTVKGNMRGGVAGSFNAVDVRDLADGVVSCCERGRKGHGYIMANDKVTMQELFDIIAQTSGCKRVTMILPAGIANFMAVLNETVSKITKKPTKMTKFAIYNLTRNNNFCCDKAVKELGYFSRPFVETIEDEVNWLRDEGKI